MTVIKVAEKRNGTTTLGKDWMSCFKMKKKIALSQT